MAEQGGLDMRPRPYYAVVGGRDGNRVVRTWPECERLTKGWPGARQAKFATRKQAEQFLQQAEASNFPAYLTELTKELLSDCYSIEAYVCAKLVADTPAEVVVPSLFFAVAMPMVGFAPGASATIWLIMLLQYQTSSTIGMLIAIAASHPRFPLSPNTFISCWNIYQMTAGGFLRDANTLPPGLRWIGYLSIQYYSHGVLSAAASADGVAEPRYSSLGIGGNITVVALIVVVLKMLLYVALRTRRLRFE